MFTEVQLWPAEDPAPVEAQIASRMPLLDPVCFVPAQDGGARVALEVLTTRQLQVRLLATFPSSVAPQVNGEPAPHRTLLAPGDVVAWADRQYRVVLINRPRIGPPPENWWGKNCPLCRVPFVAQTTAVQCRCGVLLHCEPDGAEALQCAQLSRSCPVCQKPIVLTETILPSPNHDD
jgi:hypothetical protein